MIERIDQQGIVFYRSPLLAQIGVPHGFSTRLGGVSAAPFDSLNLGNPLGCDRPDADANIRRNYERLLAGLRLAGRQHAFARQVHGNSVAIVARETEGEYAETLAAEIADRWHGQTEADALITARPEVAITVRVADCLPILLSNADGRVVAAVHAGWRGIVANVIGHAVTALAQAAGALGGGDRPGDRAGFCAAIGPGISVEHFQVGHEVAAAFTGASLADAVQRRSDRVFINLQAAALQQLAAAGIMRVDGNALCTYRDAAEFFSHRRDRGVTGRMAAAIGAARP